MFTQRMLIFSLAPVVLAVSASAGPIVYVTNGQQLGTIDLTTGAFQSIGPDPNVVPPLGYFGLTAGPNGSLIT
jgi:hypothetical protein